MQAHAAYRDRVFLLPRPLDFYLETLELGGLKVESVREASDRGRRAGLVRVPAAYNDAVLGWVGGTEKVDGAGAVRARRSPIAWRSCATRWMCCSTAGPTFQACWTYITCVNGR